MISITCTPREETAKGTNRRLRRSGAIPIVIYSKGQPAQLGSVSKSEIEAAMRSIRSGFLSTTLFTLKEQAGHDRTVVVREVQYHPTSYEIIHLDFLELEEGRLVNVKVPVDFANAAECIGVKLGGELRHIMRHVPVRCLPKNVPSCFSVDVKDLGIRKSRRVRDLVIPPTVTCLAKADVVVVAVIK